MTKRKPLPGYLLTDAERLEIADLLMHAASSLDGTANCLGGVKAAAMAAKLKERARQARKLAHRVLGL